MSLFTLFANITRAREKKGSYSLQTFVELSDNVSQSSILLKVDYLYALHNLMLVITNLLMIDE